MFDPEVIGFPSGIDGEKHTGVFGFDQAHHDDRHSDVVSDTPMLPVGEGCRVP